MDATSVIVGLLAGSGGGAVVGFIAGRLAGIPEGVYRERRRAERAEIGRQARERARLEVDSWAEFGALADSDQSPGEHPPPAGRRALGSGGAR